MLHGSLGLKIILVGATTLLLAACANVDKSQEPAVRDTGATEPVTTAPVDTGPVEGSQEHLEQQAGDRVFFAFDQYDLSNEAQATLRAQADWLRQFPAVNVTIEGHCDERGTREYNLALGERRATAAKNYLVALGIDASRIETVSYGKERPAVLGNGEDAWAQNRRAVMVVR